MACVEEVAWGHNVVRMVCQCALRHKVAATCCAADIQDVAVIALHVSVMLMLKGERYDVLM